MTTKYQILHTVASMDNQAAGVTICVHRLAQELALQELLDVHVLSVGDPGKVLRDGYIDERFARSWRSIPVLQAMGCSRTMYKKLKYARMVSVIHNHGLWMMPNVYGGWVAGQEKVTPLVISPHGMLSKGALQFSKGKKWLFWRVFQKKAAQAASCFHATCEEEYEDIRAYGITAPVAIIPNGVDIPEWKEKQTIRKSRNRVISLGRIHPKKALDRLVAAWAQLEPEFSDWDLLLVGPNQNNYAEQLNEQAAALGVKSFAISGPVYGAAKDELLRRSDLFVLPTLSENFALTVAESLAVCTPVISTKGAPWQGLEQHGCGWWIDHGVEPLAATLRTAMSLSDEERHTMGKQGREWMKRDFAWDSIARQMEEVYRWLSGGGIMPDTVRVG